MYSFNTNIINKSSENIVENFDDKFEDFKDNFDEKITEIDNKLQNIENLINVKLEICYKKVNDVYSLQNKVNEITKMNNQSIIHQINQYDEEIDDNENNENNKQNNIYNSLETSMSPQSKLDNLNNKCFIKHNNTKNQDREMFYMSSLNKNDFQSKNIMTNKTSDINLNKNFNNIVELNSTTSTSNNNSKKSNKNLNNNENNIFNNLSKKNNLKIVKDNISIDNQSNLEDFINSLPVNIMENFFHKNKDLHSSVILEMNSDDVKPCELKTDSPKFNNAMKILNETNIIKNNSQNKLNELNDKVSNTLKTETDNSENTSSNTSSKTSSNKSISNSKTSSFSEKNNVFIFSDLPKKSLLKNKVVELN
jgi:hypothetical protein